MSIGSIRARIRTASERFKQKTKADQAKHQLALSLAAEEKRSRRREEAMSEALEAARNASDLSPVYEAYPDLAEVTSRSRLSYLRSLADNDNAWHAAAIAAARAREEVAEARAVGAAIGVFAVLIPTGISTNILVSNPQNMNSPTQRLASAIVAAAILILVCLYEMRPPVPAWWRLRRSLRELKASENEFRTRAYAAAAELLSNLANDRLIHSRKDTHLRVVTAPRLVEISVADATPSRSRERVRTFVEEHTTSAIGLSGPRGVGKTTIIQDLCQTRPGRIGVYISAPVAYNSDEFLKLLQAELAKSVLRKNGAVELGEIAKVPTTLATRVGLGVIAMGIGGGVIALGRDDTFHLRTSDVAGTLLVAIGAFSFALSYIRLTRLMTLRRADRAGGDLVRLAQRTLRRLRYSMTVGQTRGNTLKFSMWELTDEDKFEAATIEPSRAERVADFRDFLHEITFGTGDEVVFGIDELDKLPKAQDALDLVNNLKDLMHVPRSHFIVSVSEDALVSFALRGVPVRDAFDSAFDFVIPVHRLTPEESDSLVRGRVVEFPYMLTLACHALSGGLPRDLIRFVRQCVDIRRSKNQDVMLAEALIELIAEQAGSFLEAVMNSTPSLAPVPARDLHRLRDILFESGSLDNDSLSDTLKAAAASWTSDSRDGESLGAYFACLHSAFVFFASLFDDPSFRDAHFASGEVFAASRDLGKAFAMLSRQPSEARARAVIVATRNGLAPCGT